MRVCQSCCICTRRSLVAFAILLFAAGVAAAAGPDLVISDFWEQNHQVQFRIRNAGDVTCGTGHVAALFANGKIQDTVTINAKLLPGASMVGTFPKFYWQCSQDGQHALAVVADYYSAIQESNEKNNTRQETWICDLTAPKITSGPSATNITETSARIIWTTDEDSDSLVRYGRKPGVYPTQASSSLMTTNHQVLLKNLEADTKYYYIVESSDAGGNTVQSQQRSFQTDPAEWPDLLVADFWETNGTITARIKNIGDATAAGHSAALYVDNQFVDSAYVPNALAPGTHYDATFQQYTWQCTQPQRDLLVVADLQNVVDESDENNNSRQETWTCDLTPPKIIAGPDVNDITTTSATVLWTTDEDSDGVVWYGTKHHSYSGHEFDATLTKSHSVALGALEPNTLYYYFVESTDESDNSVPSNERTFRTLSPQTDQPDLQVTKLWRMDHAVHYRVTNFGSATAPSGHRAALYMDGDRYDADRVTIALGPGESAEGRFPKFYFQCMDPEHELVVTADDENAVDESDETNNDRQETVACDVKLEIISGPEVQDVTPTAATIIWNTNKAADGTVEYDTHAEEFALGEDDPKLVESHEIRLAKLLPGRLYQYRVVSRNPNDEKVASAAAYFKTPIEGGNLPPVVKSLTISRQPTKMLYYKMAADVEDDTGVAYVSFFLDGKIIHTDYSEPYECPLVPAALAMSRARFFEDHSIEAVAVDGAMLSAGRLGFFEPAYECAEVTAEFREPYPGDVLYVEGETAPADTTVPITVFAAEWDWNCWVSDLGNERGEHPMFCEHGYAPLQEVRFYVNMVHIDTVTPSPWILFGHVYHTDWDVSGYRTGDYRIRVDAVANDECIQTITRDFRIETGEPRLELTRYVTRHGNYFHVELVVRNRGTVPFRCDRIVDNVDGLQPVYKFEPTCEVTPLADTDDSRRYEVDINLHSGVGVLYVEIPAYGRLTVDYLAVPVQLVAPGATARAIGADAVRVVDYFSSDDWEFDRPCVLTEDDRLFDSEMDSAIEGSDYLIVTNPSRLVAEFGSSTDTLCSMAELAIERNGILGYVSGPDWDDPLWVRDTAIQPWGAAMNGSGYLSNGYLLLVGETEIVPAWTVDIPDRSWSSGERTAEVGFSDLPYGDMSGSDNAPELAVGRIIGDAAGDLIGAMENSINSTFDRSYGLVTTGYDKAGDNFVAAGWNISDVLSDQEDAGACMGDGHRLHHWSAHVQKEQLVSGYDFPMDSGAGFLMANLSGTGVEAIRFDRYQAHVAMHGTLDLIETDFYREFFCDFASGDALARGDIDNDGADEIVVGKIGSDQIVVEYDPGHGDPEFTVELDAWDVVACGDLRDDAREEIVVARRTGGGTVRIYSYDNSGTPTLSLVGTLGIPFTAWDGFAIGDVDTSTAGNEIIVGRDDDDRIYIYDSAGGAIADVPCDPYTAYDAMAVGDFDGDGNDEIAVVIDDDVHGKRMLKLFQNDCWEADPAGGWKLKSRRHSTIYSRFLHFDGVRTTGGDSGGDGLVAADIDGDGKDELCLARAGDDRLYILDADYSQGWKDRYMPPVQADDDSIDLFVMAGHGNPGGCSPFGGADIGTLSLGAGPVAYVLSCLTGNYEGDWWWYDSGGARDDHVDGDDGFAEAFFDSGAVVYIGSTEVSPGTMNNASGPALLRTWAPDQTIGQALAAYKRAKVGDDAWWRFWVTEYNLYGDPKFGAVGGGGAAMMSLAAEAEPAAPSVHADVALTQADDISPIELSIPDYLVEPIGELDHVTIPEGDLVFEQGRPAVPYYAVTRQLPAGTLVQDVRMVERGDLQTADGLVLPLTNCVPDLEGYVATEAAPTFAGWFPTKTHDWNVIPNGDGSSTLRLRVYPFFYNRTTTEARFWRQFTFALETVASPIQVRALWTDKAVYEVGQTVTVGLGLESAGDPADVVVNAVVRRYGTDEKLAGLLLESLDALTGAASFSSHWDSANAALGICYVDVTIADLTGQILERRTTLFRLDPPADGQ